MPDDVSTLYPHPPEPNKSVLQSDPFAVIKGLNEVNALRTFQSKQAVGQEYQRGFDPSTGTFDPEAIARGVASNPNAALGAPEAAAHLTNLKGATAEAEARRLELADKQQRYVSERLSTIDPNKATPNDIHGLIVDMARNTSIPTPMLMEMQDRVLRDPNGLAHGIATLKSFSAGATGGAARVAGPPSEGGAPTTQSTSSAIFREAGGRGPQAGPASTPVALPPGEEEAFKASSDRAQKLQASATTTAQYHADLSNMKLDSQIMDKIGGPTTDIEKKWAQISQRTGGAIPSTFTPEQLRATENFDKLANQVSLNQSNIVGAGTDAGRYMSVGANPNSSMSAYGREGVIDMLQGNQDFIDTGRKKWLDYRSKGHPAHTYDDFMNKFSEVADPRVFQFNRMSKENQQKFLDHLGPEDAPEFMQRYSNAVANKWVKRPKAQ